LVRQITASVDSSLPMQVAVITGGDGALAKALASRLRSTSAWQVHAPGKRHLDVSQTDSVQSYFETLPRVDLLVNAAGVTSDRLMLHMDATAWEEVISVSLTGAMRCSRAVLAKMVGQGAGHIVLVGSHSGLVGAVGQANYAAAKAGLLGLCQSVAKEYGASGVRCNCVLPGFLNTSMTQRLAPARLAEVLAAHVLGRLNTVQDAANFIAELQKLSAVSGQVFQLDSRI
jgi:3-oxoacyl-[acyl-carrier protein] reductase